MKISYCMKCMRELEDDNSVCPYCGYQGGREDGKSYALRPGTILAGRYLVGNVLGQGGFGITYIGADLNMDGSRVAIKEYYPSRFVSRDHRRSNSLSWNLSEYGYEQWQSGSQNFLNEARKMAKIDQIPEIVRVRATFPENNTVYIVMDYVEGEDLKKYLVRNGVMDVKTCIRLLAPLMRGLGQVHQLGMIHQDISPDNIMMLPDSGLKLLDFGAALDIRFGKNDDSGRVVKPGFSPAEQYAENGRIGSWTDVYAFSATIYYCLFGKVPPASIDRVRTDRLSFEQKEQLHVPDDVVETLKDGLAVDASARIQTMEELLKRFEKYLPKEKRSGRKLAVCAVAAVAAVVAICVATGMDGRHHQKTIHYENGDTYEGLVCMRKPDDSSGRYTWANGDCYEGTFVKGKRTGRATLTANGSTYEGMFEDGKKNGSGTCSWDSGTKYEGNWWEDYPSGEGTFIYADKTAVKGSWAWITDEAVDLGRMQGTYTGNRADGVLQGLGTFTWEEGTYTGEWRGGKPDGFGTLTLHADEEYGPSERVWKFAGQDADDYPEETDPEVPVLTNGAFRLCPGYGFYAELETQEAMELLRQEDENGNASASLQLARVYQAGVEGTDADMEQALTYYEKAAELGDRAAQRALADLYYNGKDVEQDYKKAFEYYQLSAEQGDAVSYRKLGAMYERGLGTDINKEEAFRNYKKSADLNDTLGLANTGVCYEIGLGVEKDTQKAFEYYQKAAELNSPYGTYLLGNYYEYTLKDMDQAVSWYEKAADLGSDRAKDALGDVYYEGKTGQKDYAKAAGYYELSAKNIAGSSYRLGLIYKNGGYGTEVNKEDAFRYFEQAANLGSADGMYELANCYYYGTGVTQDYEKALGYFKQSAEKKNSDAYQMLGRMYEHGYGTDVNKEEAFRNYKASADLNNGLGLAHTGRCYADGIGVEKDEQAALEYYQKSAEQGSSYGTYLLGWHYKYRLKNTEQAAVWLQKAADMGNEGAKKELE